MGRDKIVEEEIFERRRLEMARLSVMSLEDWSKADVKEIRERWEKRRRELDEIEKKKTEKEKRIEEARKRKDEKRRRVIRERRCFVCNIFGHMARYCRNREKKEGPAQVPLNRFEVLKDRVMQRGEGSGREIGKDRREILREERKKNIGEKKSVQVRTPGKDKKEKKKGVEEKKQEIEKEETKEIEEEIEVEMRGFSGGEILKGRYPLAWWKVRCYECGGLGHRKRDYREMKKIDRKDETKKETKEDKKIEKEIVREEKKTEEKEVDKRDKKEDKKIEKKIEKEETKKKERVQAQTLWQRQEEEEKGYRSRNRERDS